MMVTKTQKKKFLNIDKSLTPNHFVEHRPVAHQDDDKDSPQERLGNLMIKPVQDNADESHHGKGQNRVIFFIHIHHAPNRDG